MWSRVAARRRRARAVGDVSFAAGACDGSGRPVHADGADRVRGHGWASAALTPYRLTAGRAPVGGRRGRRRRAPARARRRARCGSSRPPATRPYRVTGVADGAAAASTARPRCSSPPPTAGDALRRPRPRQRRRRARRARHRRRPTPARAAAAAGSATGVEVLDRGHAADADVGDAARRRPRVPDRHLRHDGRHRRHRRAVRRGRHIRPGDRPAPARDRGAARPRGDAAPGPPARRRRGADRVAGGQRARPARRRPAGRRARRRGRRPRRRAGGFAPGASPVPLVAALGLGIGVAQLAVVAAARRAGRVRPAEALREAAVEHAPARRRAAARRGRCSSAAASTMAIAFSGESAQSPSRSSPRMLLGDGVGLLGRRLLGLPRARSLCRCVRSAPPVCSPATTWRQPLAQRGAGHADRARRDARGDPGRPAAQRPARRPSA